MHEVKLLVQVAETALVAAGVAVVVKDESNERFEFIVPQGMARSYVAGDECEVLVRPMAEVQDGA